MHTAAGNDPMIWVWEDDNGEKCDFEPENADSVAAAVVFAGGVAGTGAGISGIYQNLNGAWAYTIASAVLAAAAYYHFSSNDEFVGIATNPTGTNPSLEPRVVLRGETNAGTIFTEFRPSSPRGPACIGC